MSWQIAARMPASLLAATEAPTPDPQTRTPRSAPAGLNRLAELARLVRIVDTRLGLEHAEVDGLVAGRFDLLQHAAAQLDAAMVEGDGYPHRGVTLPAWKARNSGASSASSCASTRSARPPSTKSGHPTSSMSAADLMAVLLAKHLRYDFDDPDDPRNDHLVFSKGHASPLRLLDVQGGGRDHRRASCSRSASSAAASRGTRRRSCPGWTWPPARSAKGFRSASASRSRASAWTSSRTGSGCCAATARWPRARCGRPSSTPGTTKLDNLTAIIDVNRLGQRGETMHGWDLDSYAKRAEAFGWHAIEIDGHDVEAIDRAYARGRSRRPAGRR